MHLQENTLLQGGEYRIIRFIDSGGFGCTYEAYQKSLDRRIAIKEFFWHEHCLRDTHTGRVTVATENNKNDFEKLRDKFVNEARTIAKLHHPGIVRVSAVFEENGTAYYVMDYIEGCSFGDLVSGGKALSEVKALRYIRQVAEALQYVHSKNRLHLDIKPSNIMLDNEGHVILIDFGVSKQYDQSTGLNPSTLLGKSRGYSSIEQMGGDVKTFAPATDIYSLGATLYTLLVGNRPPEAAYIIKGVPIAPLQARGVSSTTIRAIQAAMQADKEDRPQSVAEFLALLDGKKDSDKTHFDDGVTDYNAPGKTDYEEPKKPTPKQKSKPQPRKNLTWLWVTLVGIAGILLTIVGTNSYQAHQTKIAREQFVADSIAARQRFVADSIAFYQATHGRINGHEWVDLGLSVKWATCNIGASSPSDWGNYYAWGETTTKTTYTYANSVTYDKNIGEICGDSEYDAARRNWGDSWRMPTKAELRELFNNCTWTWTTQGGHNGYRVTSKKNGNSIFLPAAGYRDGSSLYHRGEYCTYWSSTPHESHTESAYYLSRSSSIYFVYWYDRSYGFTVRPVCD
ncbi:MAG: protein kinase [Bacteroidaceae bacterium]|nr:protein kinase [Bacteroidaceae bacterium]